MLDDNQRSGELFRLRTSSTVIGRKSGDIRVPQDSWMSVKHARIARREGPQGWRWTLRDLKSTNGVYVRVTAARLRNGDQLLIGNRTVRFVQGKTVGDPSRLDELHGEQTGQQLLLTEATTEIGRDRGACADFLADEPTLDPRGICFRFDEGIGWSVAAERTTNGLWARVAKVELIHGAMFQLGEQRFAFACP